MAVEKEQLLELLTEAREFKKLVDSILNDLGHVSDSKMSQYQRHFFELKKLNDATGLNLELKKPFETIYDVKADRNAETIKDEINRFLSSVQKEIYKIDYPTTVKKESPDFSRTLYVTESENNFYVHENGIVKKIDLNKGASYFKAFKVAYDLKPSGGLILYDDLLLKIQEAFGIKENNKKEAKKSIAQFLTGNTKGIKASELGEALSNSVRSNLFKTKKTEGIYFNNAKTI